jgi:hypothetical protein
VISVPLIGMFVVDIGIIAFLTWQGLGLIENPKRWLERHGRSTADNHIRATRLIGLAALLVVLLILRHLVRQLWF